MLHKLIKITLGFLLLLSVSSFAQDKVLVRIGVMPVIEHLPLVLSEKESVVSLHKAKVKLDMYTSWTALEAAYRTGAVDAAAITLPKALLMAYDGVPLKIVLVVNRNGTSLVLNSDSPSELKGKIVGGSGSDTMQLVVFDKFLKSINLSLGYDVRFILIPFSRALPLFEKNRIYGFCLPEPYGAYAQNKHLARKVILSKDIIPQHIDSVLIVNPNLIKKHPSVVKEIVKSITLSAKFIEDDKKSSSSRQTAMSQLSVFNIPPKVVREALTNPYDRVLFKNLIPSSKEIADIMDTLIKLEVLKGKINLKKIIDTSFIE